MLRYIPPSPNSLIGCQTKRIKIFIVETKIATWNVRSLLQSGKFGNAVKEIKRLRIKIMGLSEVRWPKSESLRMDGAHMFFSRGQESRINYGVAIIVDEDIAEAVIEFVPLSERVMISLQTNFREMNII